MPFEPIQQLDIENYGCIKKARFTLTPLHALIGPNDSGKSTTLRALRTVAHYAVGGGGTPDPMFGGNSSITIGYADELAYQVRPNEATAEVRESIFSRKSPLDSLWHQSRSLKASGIPEVRATVISGTEAPDYHGLLSARLTRATMIRFDPNALRGPSGQLLSTKPVQFFDETGLGLASVYQAINSRDVDAFVSIRDKARKFFPTIQNILVPAVDSNRVVLQARLKDDTLVPAEALSEGLLYFLGFMALQHVVGSNLFLVEEPENGLHPARISELMAILREISKTGQVIIATHSPLVVNEQKGDEVSVVTRDPDKGTEVKLLKDVPGFDDASKVYQLGEFWVSYCDGDQEEPLVHGRPRP